MLNLIRNENMKIYSRVRTWVLLGILVFLTVGLPFLVATINTENADWRKQVTADVEMGRAQLDSTIETVQKNAEQLVKIGEYRLEHNIPPSRGSLWGNMLSVAPPLVMFVGVFTVIVASDIVAGEFANGTIKLLLIRPANRTKILLAKYGATLLFSLTLFAVQFAVSYLVNGLLSGFAGNSIPHLYLGGDGLVHERSMLFHILGTQGLECISLIMVVTLAFMISSAFRSGALALAMSLIFYLAGSLPSLLLAKYEWMKFYLFNNTDLTVYMNGTPPYESMTVGFSIGVLVAYFILFHLVAWLLFVKRDVAS